MAKKTFTSEEVYDLGFAHGHAAGLVDALGNLVGTNQRVYDLTPHDLDTLAMGIALVVLHAADIDTVAATMETQQKLGIAEKTLGWLHLICEPPAPVDDKIVLHETDPNPWLNPDTVPGWEHAATQQFTPTTEELREFHPGAGADDDLPF
jgi:hypothetical protein